MPKKIIFCSQDPGSANALTPVIKKLEQGNQFTVQVFATKQSCEFFNQAGISFQDLNGKLFNQQVITEKPDLIILGASSGFSIEKQAIIYGKDNTIPTVSILDFWSNYALRYSGNGNDLVYLPDYIFTMDEISKTRMIKEKIPKNKIIVTGNPFFDTFLESNESKEKQPHKDYSQENTAHKNNILYISQPLVKEGKFIPDTKTIDECIKIIKEMSEDISLTIKCHPKEDHLRYHEAFKNAKISVTVLGKSDVKKLIETHQIILGKHSMVLFQAVCLGKTVISYQPIQKKYDCLITNDLGISYRANNIEELKSLLKKSIKKSLPSTDRNQISRYIDGKNTTRVISEIKKILNIKNQ
ncbi:hypothetical protein HOA92_02180 [archaeon]|jgi:hypothetical protein|nr:hypothetical protein [archaeon]MBT6761822.1 hypothetical protein [archaeon]